MYPYKINAPIRVDHSKVVSYLKPHPFGDMWATRDALDYYLQDMFDGEFKVVLDTDSSLVIERSF